MVKQKAHKRVETNQRKPKNKIIVLIILLLIIGLVIFLIKFNHNTAKNLKMGNNMSSQEVIDYFLNISSYEAKIEVEVVSNKNKSRYQLKQQYKGPDENTQEVLEPENIAGVKIMKNGNQLKMENTKLSLSTIFENYEYLSDNVLDLSCFINEYKNNEKRDWKEESDQIVLQIKQEGIEKTLWIDKNTAKPIKLNIKWTNKRNEVYISYNEVNINCF